MAHGLTAEELMEPDHALIQFCGPLHALSTCLLRHFDCCALNPHHEILPPTLTPVSFHSSLSASSACSPPGCGASGGCRSAASSEAAQPI